MAQVISLQQTLVSFRSILQEEESSLISIQELVDYSTQKPYATSKSLKTRSYYQTGTTNVLQ